jgi:gamma-butyrobetaine dioxygenase
VCRTLLLTGAMLRQVRPEIDLAAIEAGGDGLLRWLRLLRDYSCVFVRGVPTRVGAVLDLAERIAFVQETNFGRSFQVVSKPDPENLAFTSAKLTAHTDVPNRRALPGLQFLHCIEFKARGGESILIGGYLAAGRLREQDPEAHDLLASVAIPYRFADDHHDIRNRSPVIGVDGDGRYTEIRFHPALMAPLDFDPDLMRHYYRALGAFGRIVRDPELELVFTMEPGDCQVFDNRRVLHARAAFDPSSGPRHLEGCYVDRDDFLSRLRVLERAGQDGCASNVRPASPRGVLADLACGSQPSGGCQSNGRKAGDGQSSYE